MLNENNRIPYASTGAQTIRNADYFAQQQAVRELAEVGGLVAFVDGSCRFCAQQMPILTMLRNNFGMETLVVSIDGKAPKGYKGPIVKDNGLYSKLQLKLSPSVVFVPKPKAYNGEIDPNKYLVISQGFYAADEMVKLIAFAGHSTNLLSQSTMRDLDVWKRGVASTDDLQALKLDPNKPETFKEKLQPILQKQYK
jgi:conjugal transfer pilus assembly protein TraF